MKVITVNLSRSYVEAIDAAVDNTRDPSNNKIRPTRCEFIRNAIINFVINQIAIFNQQYMNKRKVEQIIANNNIQSDIVTVPIDKAGDPTDPAHYKQYRIVNKETKRKAERDVIQ